MQFCTTHSHITLWTLVSLMFLVSVTGCIESSSKNSSIQTASISTHKTSSRTQLPELLPRNAALGSAEEQQEMQNIYRDLTNKISQDPTDYRSQLQLTQLFMLEARVTGEHGHYYPAALSILESLLSQQPAKDVEFAALSLKASVYLSLHRFAEAKDLAQTAVTLNSYNSLIYGSLVDANVELGDYQTAVEMADKMVSIRPDLRSYSRVSYLRELHGDMTGAIEAMTMAAESGFPGYEETAWCRLTLGELYEQTGDLTTAKQQYEQILAERPQYPFAMAAIAGIEAKEGLFEAAENRLKQAIAIIPEFSFYEQLASIYQQTDRQDEADAMIAEILEMLADDEAKGHKMGLEYANLYLNHLNDPQTALIYAQKEYDLRPTNIDVNRVMAHIHMELGKIDQARDFLAIAIRTGYQHPDLLHLVDQILG